MMLTQNWIFNESFLQQLNDSASRPSDGRGWKGEEDQVSSMTVMMMVMVMMMMSFLQKDKNKLTSYCPRSILVTQDPWVSRSSQTTTFPLFANINKCAFCQLRKCNNALGVILTPQITWIDVGNIYFVFSEQICLLFADVPARAALTCLSGTRSELLISKHIKHSVKTFANSWQKSLPSGRREQKLGGGEKNTMIQIVSISRPSLFPKLIFWSRLNLIIPLNFSR